MIKKIKLFPNKNKSNAVKMAKLLENKLIEKSFQLVDKDFDLGIAIGGDGTFLRMVSNSNFNSECFFIGINKGTLGFTSEVTDENLDIFLHQLEDNSFSYENIGVQEIAIQTNDTVSHLFSLNEIVVRDKDLNTTKLKIFIDDKLLEEYVGDGILVATSFGSTAYNLSFGGSIVYNTFHTLQITPIAPLNNKSYRNLLNSLIIPDHKKVILFPKKNSQNLIISIDGTNYIYENVTKIETFIGTKRIKMLRMQEYSFIEKLNEKFLS